MESNRRDMANVFQTICGIQVEVWTSEPQVGDVSLSDSFNIDDIGAVENEYKYFARWKLEFLANTARTSSPECSSFQVDYTDPGDFPTQEFLAEQDKLYDYRR